MKIVQITDTHISHLGGVPTANFEKIARFVNEVLRPTFVVHSGDVSILNPDMAADREAAKSAFELIEAPMRVLPGNHDVGEPGPEPWGGFKATSERTNAFTSLFGPDHWVEIVGDYAVVGFNSEILSTGIPEEQAQWEWLETVPDATGGRPTLVFCHKPFWTPMAHPAHAMSVPAEALDRLLDSLAGADVKIFGSGHLHRYLREERGAALAVSGPSTAFMAKINADLSNPGLDQLGVVEYDCENGEVEAHFRSIPTLVEGGPNDIKEFKLALEEIGVTVDI